jgi:hypothetical protein
MHESPTLFYREARSRFSRSMRTLIESHAHPSRKGHAHPSIALHRAAPSYATVSLSSFDVPRREDVRVVARDLGNCRERDGRLSRQVLPARTELVNPR